MTIQMSANGVSDPIAILGPSTVNQYKLPPSLIVSLSEGAVLQYRIEATGDAPSYVNGSIGNPRTFPTPGNWEVLEPPLRGNIFLDSSVTIPLKSMVTGVRIRLVQYTGGTLTFQVAE